MNSLRSCKRQRIRFMYTHGARRRGGKSPKGLQLAYSSWNNMWKRCVNPSTKGYARYGGSGISVCARWKSFENFLADMGERPSGKSLDRYPDNSGNYEPGNCRWATRREQAGNSKSVKLITVNGETNSVAELARHAGICRHVVYKRLRAGWTPLEAISTPKAKRD